MGGASPYTRPGPLSKWLFLSCYPVLALLCELLYELHEGKTLSTLFISVPRGAQRHREMPNQCSSRQQFHPLVFFYSKDSELCLCFRLIAINYFMSLVAQWFTDLGSSLGTHSKMTFYIRGAAAQEFSTLCHVLEASFLLSLICTVKFEDYGSMSGLTHFA